MHRRPHEAHLHTNGTLEVYNDKHQLLYGQSGYMVSLEVAREVCAEAQRFYIVREDGSEFRVTRLKASLLLGLRVPPVV